MSWSGKYSPARIRSEISLVDLLPTLLDMATEGQGCASVVETDGHSLFPIIANQHLDWSHPVISEFSADGSTGPSRMVLRDRLKYMYLEGVEEMLIDLDADPLELKNLVGSPDYGRQFTELRNLAMKGWNPDELRERILENQAQRLFIHGVTRGDPTYVYTLSDDDNRKYVRNTGAADTKARARFPYVEPSLPSTFTDH